MLSSPVISVIDDDEPTRAAVTSLMRAKGFTPSTYESAESFLEAAAHKACQCIITDILMPGLSGIELKQRLNDDSCVVPVIMISARVEERLQSIALEAGAFCVLRKPFKAQALLACVERALKQ